MESSVEEEMLPGKVVFIKGTHKTENKGKSSDFKMSKRFVILDILRKVAISIHPHLQMLFLHEHTHTEPTITLLPPHCIATSQHTGNTSRSESTPKGCQIFGSSLQK